MKQHCIPASTMDSWGFDYTTINSLLDANPKWHKLKSTSWSKVYSHLKRSGTVKDEFRKYLNVIAPGESEEQTATKVLINLMKKNEPDSKYLSSYHRGEITPETAKKRFGVTPEDLRTVYDGAVAASDCSFTKLASFFAGIPKSATNKGDLVKKMFVGVRLSLVSLRWYKKQPRKRRKNKRTMCTVTRKRIVEKSNIPPAHIMTQKKRSSLIILRML